MSESSNPIYKACPNCGGTVEADSKFCKHCASGLTNSGQSSKQTVAASNNHSGRKIGYILLIGGLATVLVIVLIVIFISRSRGTQANVTNVAPSMPSPSPSVSDRARQVEEKILRGEALTDSDIAGLSAYELCVLRNVHFARYGRKYDQTGELGSYFYTRP